MYSDWPWGAGFELMMKSKMERKPTMARRVTIAFPMAETNENMASAMSGMAATSLEMNMRSFNISASLIIRVLFIIALFSVSAIALATDFTDVEYLKNYDGDTFTVNIKGVPDVFGKEISVRIRGVDTPELNASRKCEKTAADSARKFLRRTIASTKLKLIGCERDKYFRLLCTVKAGDVDVGDRILKGRWGIPYDGGTKTDWYCGNPEKQD